MRYSVFWKGVLAAAAIALSVESSDMPPGQGLVKSECTNKHRHCLSWAQRGECQKNPGYMLPHCPVACKQCGECTNKHRHCLSWAQRGECQKNPGYMLPHCPVACKQCDPVSPPSCSCGIANTVNRIIGGSEVDPPRKYPWLVALHMHGHRAYCGGSIINSRYILTAAHCLYEFPENEPCYYDPPEQINILIGDHHLFATDDDSRNTNTIRVKRNITHLGYNCENHDNDFALLELSQDIQFNDVIKPVCLPEDDTKSYKSVMGTAAGWGKKDDGHFSHTPFEVDLPILDTNCGGYESITANMMCAGFPESGGKDACQGDSGGPFVVQEDGKYVQVGVVSWGKGCAREKHPGVYARVSKVLDWIKSNSAEGQSCTN